MITDAAALFTALRAAGIHGRTRTITTEWAVIRRATLTGGRWMQAHVARTINGATVRTFTIDNGVDADRAREIAASMGWEI